MSRKCHESVTKVSRKCHKSVTKVAQKCHKSVTKSNTKGVTKSITKSITKVSKMPLKLKYSQGFEADGKRLISNLMVPVSISVRVVELLSSARLI